MCLAASAAACGGDAGKADADDARPASTVTLYVVDESGKLTPVEHEVPGAADMRPQGRALAAVKALVAGEAADGTTTHWGGRCAAGAKVEQLVAEGRLITLRVNGPAGVVCQRSGAKLVQQKQQLAWTLVENFGADPATAVRVYGPNGGQIWGDLVVDEKILAD